MVYLLGRAQTPNTTAARNLSVLEQPPTDAAIPVFIRGQFLNDAALNTRDQAVGTYFSQFLHVDEVPAKFGFTIHENLQRTQMFIKLQLKGDKSSSITIDLTPLEEAVNYEDAKENVRLQRMDPEIRESVRVAWKKRKEKQIGESNP